MMKLLRIALLGLAVLGGVVFVAVGSIAGWSLYERTRRAPDPDAVATQVRDIARLETLEVSLYKKVSFEPEPQLTGALGRDVVTWAKFTLRPPKGRAIVFATARVGIDFAKLDRQHLRVGADEVWVRLPPLLTHVELHPGETEVIGSNLDSAQTAQLLQVAKEAFEAEVSANQALRERAIGSAERNIRGLLLTLGFQRVHFVPELPVAVAPN